MFFTFFTPWAFLGLLAVPVLVGIYWLRTRSRPVTVSSLLLWQDPTEVRTGGLRFEALRTPLLFLLELLAIILLVLAAAGPWLQTMLGSQVLVLVLDDSYSMQAGNADSPRSKALEALKQFQPGRRWHSVRVVLAGARPQLFGESVHTIEAALSQLAGWKCNAAQANVPEAVAFAAELAGPDALVLVVTDHKPEKEITAGRVQWWAFGQPKANLAIVSAARSHREDFERCLFEVGNLSRDAKSASLFVDKGQGNVERFRLNMKGGETKRVFLRWHPTKEDKTAAVKAWLNDDALPIDNQVLLLEQPRRQVRVQLDISNDDLRSHFKKALLASELALLVTRRPHLLITDRAEPSTGAKTWILQILTEKDAVPYLGPFLSDRGHTLLQGLSFHGLVWGAGKSKGVGGTPILLAGNVPLLTDSVTATGAYHLRLRLQPELSTLLDRPTWPVFIWNLLQWRSSELPGLQRANLRLGETTVLTTRDKSETVELVLPDTTTVKLPVHGSEVVLQPEQVGAYTVHAADSEQRLSCNALSAEESDLSSCASGRWGHWEDVSANAGLESAVWMVLLLAAAILSAHLFLVSRTGRQSGV